MVRPATRHNAVGPHQWEIVMKMDCNELWESDGYFEVRAHMVDSR